MSVLSNSAQTTFGFQRSSRNSTTYEAFSNCFFRTSSMPATQRATATIAGHPLHDMLVPTPLTCFIGTFFTDLAYWATTTMQWANMSLWLLTAGLIMSVLAALTGLIDFAGDRRIRDITAAWIHGGGNGLALILSLFNIFIHSRD